jgi:hypothetical protein
MATLQMGTMEIEMGGLEGIPEPPVDRLLVEEKGGRRQEVTPSTGMEGIHLRSLLISEEMVQALVAARPGEVVLTTDFLT